MIDSSNPRIYWNTLKKRHPELVNFSKQAKLYSSDNKKYFTDVIDEVGIRQLSILVRSKNNIAFQTWLKGGLDPIDEQSKRKAYELYKANLFDKSEIGKTISLEKIHAYLFEGLYPFAGRIRTKTISKGGFTFANADYLLGTLSNIDNMEDGNFNQIVDKYIEMNIAHPFMEGNERATRIWLDFLLIDRLSKCIDWSKIEKHQYLDAMSKSPYDPALIKDLLKGALTDDINNRELFIKGIDCSYYYEEIDKIL